MPTGWCPGDRAITEMLDLYPGSTAVRVFFGPGEGLPPAAWTDPAWNPRQRLSALPAGCTVVVSHKDQQVDAAAFVDAWLAARPDVRLVLVAHHEPEQGKGGDPTPAQFRTSWTRQRQQVGAHPARADGRLRLAVCYTLQWIRGGGNWRTWWPDHEAAAVDLVLFDWYQYDPTGRNPYRPVRYEPPAAAIAPMTAIASEVGKPWGIAEIDHLRITVGNGFTADVDPDGTGCATWYRQMHAAAKAAGCAVWCHFHRGHGDLTERLPEQQALRELIAQEVPVTTAPSNLLAVRQLLLAYLNVDKDTVRSQDLEPAEVGIVGDPNHRGGYHCGSDRMVRNDYSVVESTRDSSGLTVHASALDVGLFTVRVDGRIHDLPSFSTWCVDQCQAGAPDTRDIREIIYSPDGKVVRRWDRLGRRSDGDSSHLFHTHFSFFRDSTKAGRDQTPLFRRYLTSIGLIPGEDDMDAKQFIAILSDPTVQALMRGFAWQYAGRGLGANDSTPAGNISTLGALSETLLTVRAIAGKVDIDPAELEQIRAAAREGAASAADALVAAVLAKLPPDTLTRADVEAAVRDAFAGGLAPDAG